jgi:hypothetical protein
VRELNRVISLATAFFLLQKNFGLKELKELQKKKIVSDRVISLATTFFLPQKSLVFKEQK